MTRRIGDWEGRRESSEMGSGMKKLTIVGMATVGLGLAGLISYGAFTTYIHPNEFAVKESKYGGGIENKVYKGGELYFEGVGVTFHRFPKTWQVLDFNNVDFEKKLEGEVEGYGHEPSLEVSSSDGFKNTFDVTVIYRITDPSIVIDNVKGVGKGRLFEDYVRRKVHPALQSTLGKMAAERLYNVEERRKYNQEALEQLNAEMTPKGIEVHEVLIRRFAYNPEYEAKIHAKVLQEQLKITEQEQAKAATRLAEVNKIVAEGQANKGVEAQTAAAKITQTNAEASNYHRKKTAEGDLLVKKAEAEGQELVNRAYEGPGAEKMVGVKMAKKVAAAVETIYVKSCDEGGVNPLDLGSMLKKLTTR